MTGWVYNRQHRSLVRIKQVRQPPYVLARYAQRWHGLCALCHEPISANVQTLAQLSTIKSMPTLCQTCHELMTWRLAPMRLELNTHSSHQYAKATPAQSFAIYFATFYQYPINQALNQFKDHENLSALMVLLHAIHQLPKPVGATPANTAIIPMPTTNNRLVKRGFDPVTILAKSLAHHWQLPIWQGLVRTDESLHQRGLDKHARLNNIQDVFMLQDTPPVRQLILFDDVVTTGATMQAAASAIITHTPSVRLMAVCVAHGSAQFSALSHTWSQEVL